MDKTKQKQLFKFIGILAVIYFILFLFSKNYVIGVSSTPSLPSDFYLIDKNKKEYKMGDVIAFRFPNSDSIYEKKGDKLFKIVACLEGMELIAKNGNFKCNGKELTKARNTDSKGRKVEPFEFEGKIPKGKIFGMGTHFKSYDSRYFGFIDKKDLIGVAIF